MTAEVAILNKSAVALAADSAKTVGDLGKIYPANKLFALTKHHPIGVMIYNNPEFMGIPWGTWIKTYRRKLGTRALPTCEAYAKNLIEYVENHPICTEEREVENLLRIASNVYWEISRTVLATLHDTLVQTRRITLRDESRALRQAVDDRLSVLVSLKASKLVNKVEANRFIAKNLSAIDDCIDREFSDFKVSQTLRLSLHRILRLSIQCAQMSNTRSGVVIAGFGETEMFPQLVHVSTEGIVGGHHRHVTRVVDDIGQAQTAGYIYAMAQADMVSLYMEGVDKKLLRYIMLSAEEAVVDLSEALVRKAGGSASQIKGAKKSAHALIKQFEKKVTRYKKEKFIWPTVEMVSHLPKEEMAEMAEALVSLTSMRRRVSYDQETVSGPIDVAIISKGDGLIWIKRKHYFKPELNPSYFDRQTAESN